MMNNQVLFITRHLLNGVGGGRFAACALLQALSVLYGERLMIIAPLGGERIELPHQAGRFISVPPRPWVHKAWGLLTLQSADRLSPVFDRWLRAETDLKTSLAVLDSGYLGRFAPRLQARGIPVVTCHHNVEVDYVRDIKYGPLPPLLALHIVGKNERVAVQNSALNLTLTPDDADRLRELYGRSRDIVVKTLGAFEGMHSPPLSPLSPQKREAGAGLHIVSTGSLCDQQSEDGLTWFMADILPPLREVLPGLRVTIAGRSPGERLVKLAAASGVRLIADPPDMQPLLQEADLYLSPIRKGSGLKLRLMDAFRAGLPVVSHSVSARGYRGLFPEDALATFDTEEDCVGAVRRLADRLPLHLSARQAIQDVYAHHFAFAAGVERLRRILHTFLPQWARP